MAIVNEEECHLDVQRPLGFAEYGLDDYGRRARGQPRDSDPHVQVEPVLASLEDDVGTMLYSSEFQSSMSEVIGPAWPPGRDFGRERYRRCREALDSYLKDHFHHITQIHQ